MRLIDADALKKEWRMGDVCQMCAQDTRQCGNDYCFSRMDVCSMIDDAPTVDMQKLWKALYAEEDKLEKKYVGTPEHNNWFMVYRPWLQDGFGIAIRALSDTFTPELSKEGEVE